MIDPKAVERRRSALYRMAGNIASGILASPHVDPDTVADAVAEMSVAVAEQIIEIVDRDHPMPERDRS